MQNLALTIRERARSDAHRGAVAMRVKRDDVWQETTYATLDETAGQLSRGHVGLGHAV